MKIKTMEKILQNGTIVKTKSDDYIKSGAEFQRYCSKLGIPKNISLAMFIIGDRIRPHYYETDEAALKVASEGFKQLPSVIIL